MAGVASVSSRLAFTHAEALAAAVFADHAVGPAYVHEVFLARFLTGKCVEQAHDAHTTVGVSHEAIL